MNCVQRLAIYKYLQNVQECCMMKAKLLEHKFSYSMAPRNEQKKGFSMLVHFFMASEAL